MHIGFILLIFPKVAHENKVSIYVLDYVKTVKIKEKIVIRKVKELTNKNFNFIKTVEFIKEHEGWSAIPYKDENGYKTIGYGFMLRYIEPKFRDSLTKTEACNIIIKKLKNNIKLAGKIYPKLNKNQVLAVAHLIYGKGFGRLKKHALHQQLLENNVRYNTWLYFSEYEKTRKNYRKSREYELKLYGFNSNQK